jgi:hypothetical protein
MQIATLECGDVKLSAPLHRIEKLIASLFAEPAVTEVRTVIGVLLHEGEDYAGLVFDAETGEPSHHLILLPGEFKGGWQQALDWAASIGGELPTRQEQSFLFAQLKRLFSGDWHWSCAQCSSGVAWAQYFRGGTQHGVFKVTSSRARAVRRVAYSSIQ